MFCFDFDLLISAISSNFSFYAATKTPVLILDFLKLLIKRALSPRLCTCASSDDSHCLIANRNQRNTPSTFILTSIDLKSLPKSLRSATVCALLLFFCQ